MMAFEYIAVYGSGRYIRHNWIQCITTRGLSDGDGRWGKVEGCWGCNISVRLYLFLYFSLCFNMALSQEVRCWDVGAARTHSFTSDSHAHAPQRETTGVALKLSLFSVEEQNLFPGSESLGVSSPHNGRVRLPLSLSLSVRLSLKRSDSQQASWPFPAN